MNIHCSLFILLLSSWGKRKPTVQDVGRTDTSKTFLMKKVYLKLKGKKWREWLTAERRVFQTCLLLVCLIRTWHSWCVLHQNAGYEYSPDFCKSNCKEQSINNFPSNWLPLWKIRTIYCVLNILWSVLCIKIQLRDQSDEPSNALLLLYRKCMFVLFLCIENCDEPRRWQRAKYECKRNSFSLTLDYYVICFIRTFGWNVQYVIYSQCLHTVLYAYHVCHLLYMIRYILNSVHVLFMGNKSWLFFTISMFKNVAIMDHLYSLHLLYSYGWYQFLK